MLRILTVALPRLTKEQAVKAAIWHNPECGKSRATLALLEERRDIELTVVDYLKHPPSREKLAQLYRGAGMAPREGVRTFKTNAEERGLTTADDDTVLDAMVAEPRLIERPLVETEKGVRLCRPPEKVEEIL
jgi:arsenate reductase